MSVEQAIANLLIALGEDVVYGSLELHFENRRFASLVVKKHHKRASAVTATTASAVKTALPVRPAVPDSTRGRRM